MENSSICNTQKLETNCNKNLSGFITKLNQCTNSLMKHAAELKYIGADLVVKSKQLQQLENIKPDNIRCYTIEQKDRVLVELWNQINLRIITVKEIIQDLECFHKGLTIDYHNLLASANSVLISSVESVIIKGDCKQKPLSFYLDDACQILYKWKHYQRILNTALDQINIRDSDSVKQFEHMTTLPQDLSSYLDRYLMYSMFLIRT